MLIETAALVTLVATGTLLFGVKGTILAGILATVAVLFQSLRLTGQFSDLTEDIIRTMSIDRSHRLDPTGPAELARMARAVNRLVDRVGAEIHEEAEERIRLASILDSIHEGVVVVDDQGVIESANPAASEMLGTIGEVEPGMQFTSLTYHPDVNSVVGRTIEDGNPTSMEIELTEILGYQRYHTSIVGPRRQLRKDYFVTCYEHLHPEYPCSPKVRGNRFSDTLCL